MSILERMRGSTDSTPMQIILVLIVVAFIGWFSLPQAETVAGRKGSRAPQRRRSAVPARGPGQGDAPGAAGAHDGASRCSAAQLCRSLGSAEMERRPYKRAGDGRVTCA